MIESVAHGEQSTEASFEGEAAEQPDAGEQAAHEADPGSNSQPLLAQEEAPEALAPEAARLEAPEPEQVPENIIPEPKPEPVALESSPAEVAEPLHDAPAPVASQSPAAPETAAPQPAASQASASSVARRLLDKLGSQQGIWLSYVEGEIEARLAFAGALQNVRTPSDLAVKSNAEYVRVLISSNNLIADLLVSQMRSA
ncbi:hypothetical protein [Methylobacterium nodulans]|uniref:Uncharacterized protein n=1 Tax=Methylobacterium nodulans (strain LMG 21967 / CNCM I-2342 / ORS 2060) TaxID=460265 RepID=B8IB88_METNO|nr:hypothetical protein [Methylobacterium nodulans]ACL57303.1 conserved hypothetical protein [Methylobacterium nodulans ORS 2060]